MVKVSVGVDVAALGVFGEGAQFGAGEGLEGTFYFGLGCQGCQLAIH